MRKKDLVLKRACRLAVFAVPAAALVCAAWLILRVLRWYSWFDPWKLLLLIVPALVILRLARLLRSDRRKKALRAVLWVLLCLPVLLMAVSDLNTSFCSMKENYGVRLPKGGRVVRDCACYVGFDRTELCEIDYDGSVPDMDFLWKERDPEADAILDRIIGELRTADSRRPLEDVELLSEIEAKGGALLSCVVKNEPYRLCLLLYDREAQVLYLCELKM